MIHIRNFHLNLKINKKPYDDDDIYYMNYITIKKFSDCENIHNVNPLYLIIRSATGYFNERNDKKYLVIDLTEKYEEVFSGIRSEIETLNDGKKLFYGKDYAKIGVRTDDNLALNKQLKFPTFIIIIGCVFKKSGKLYP